jgi:hypothetical protein
VDRSSGDRGALKGDLREAKQMGDLKHGSLEQCGNM